MFKLDVKEKNTSKSTDNSGCWIEFSPTIEAWKQSLRKILVLEVHHHEVNIFQQTHKSVTG